MVWFMVFNATLSCHTKCYYIWQSNLRIMDITCVFNVYYI